jgi:hypothetical protein
MLKLFEMELLAFTADSSLATSYNGLRRLIKNGENYVRLVECCLGTLTGANPDLNLILSLQQQSDVFSALRINYGIRYNGSSKRY